MAIRTACLLAISVCVLLGCGGAAGPPAGDEGGGCFPNGTCNAGLSCLSTFCVRVVVGDAGLDGRAGSAGTAGSGAAGTGAAGAGAAGAGAAGTGGASGAAAESGTAGAPFTPAPHPDLPQVGTLGGPVLLTPKVKPIFYSDDTALPDIEMFLTELTHTSYWASTTGEYGVGALKVLPAVVLPLNAPGTTTDMALQSEIVANTSGSNPAWGAADPSVIYLLVIPEGATITNGTDTCCTDFGGYHSEVASGTTAVSYAVGCTCPGFLGGTMLDARTSAISHELVESATDPFPYSNPAYSVEDRADIVWNAINGGGEVGDMCAFNDDAYYIPAGAKYMVQRTWSNAAAKKMQNPCVPYATTAPYFNAFPALEAIKFGADKFMTRGLNVPFGTSRTIDVTLYSSAPTKGTWTVSAYDYVSWFLGLPPDLGLTLDKTEGMNGDTLHLTVTPKVKPSDPNAADAFILVSHYGTVRDPDYQTNLTISLVAD